MSFDKTLRASTCCMSMPAESIQSYRLIPGTEIDTLKWDSCVHYATHAAFSGYSWYLNGYNRDWVGLVEGDYETVLPLFHQRDIWGRRRYSQPHHFAPNGPFSIHVLSRPRILALLRALPPAVRNMLIAWEGQVGLPGVMDRLLPRTLLHLYEEAEALEARFAKDLPDPPKTGQVTQITPERLTAFWQRVTPRYRGKEKDLHRYHRIMYQSMHRGLGFATAYVDPQGQPLAVAFFVTSHGYLYRLISARIRGPVGDAAWAQLLRTLIFTHAGRPLVLDLNGDPWAERFGGDTVNYTLLDTSGKRG